MSTMSTTGHDLHVRSESERSQNMRADRGPWYRTDEMVVTITHER